jgi:hypothetical protein
MDNNGNSPTGEKPESDISKNGRWERARREWKTCYSALKPILLPIPGGWGRLESFLGGQSPQLSWREKNRMLKL